jgi:hypothetical protein
MVRTFSFGVLITCSFGDEGVDPGSLSSLAARIAPFGVDALLVATSGSEGIEPVTALSAIAASNDLVLGAVISLGSGRNPGIVAKMATTLALLAPGRSALIFSADRADAPRQLLEAVEVAVSLRADGPLHAGGTEFFVRDAFNEPRPAPADALGIGVIVDQPTTELRSLSDLVIVRVGGNEALRTDPRVLPLFYEAVPRENGRGPLVVQAGGSSVDHVADVVAEIASRRR